MTCLTDTQKMTQGEINAKLVRLLDAEADEKRRFWATLTPEQQRRGKHHIETVKAIHAHHARFNR